MLNKPSSSPNQISEDRETRLQALIEQLRPNAEHTLRQMAEQLLDLPDDQCFGQLEYTLRDLAHDLAAASHQTGLQAGKKGGTQVPAPFVRAAKATPVSSVTVTKPSSPRVAK